MFPAVPAFLSAPLQSADEVFEPIATPDIEWSVLVPFLILVGAALGLMTITVVVRAKLFAGAYAIVTVVAGLAAAVAAWPVWERVQDPDRGPFTAVAGAIGVDGFSVAAFHSQGVQLAPAAGRILARQLVDGEPTEYYDAVSISRFEGYGDGRDVE